MIEKIKEYWDNQIPHLENDNSGIDFYNKISEHRYSLHPHLKPFVGFEKFSGKRVLEVGFGAGTDLCEFVSNGAIVNGIDISDKAIDLCKKRLEVEGLSADIRLYDGVKFPFENNTFYCVYSWGVFHHNPNIYDLLIESYRVLKPGGQLILMLYHKNSILYYYSILYLRWFNSKLTKDKALSNYSEYREECPYTEVFSSEEIKEFLFLFRTVETSVDFPVYDTLTERKINTTKPIEFNRTNVFEIDNFIDCFNNDVRAGNDLKKYGWHLLVNAIK